MKKKGFTLIELLAVIVVLAIIALIATPMVLNTIEDAKKGAAKADAYVYAEEVERYMVLAQLDPTKPQLQPGVTYQLSSKKYEIASLANPDEVFINDLVQIKGDKPTSGYVILSANGKVEKMEMVMASYPIECKDDVCEIKGESVKDEVEDDNTDTGADDEVIVYDKIIDKAKTLVYDDTGVCKTDGSTYNYMGGCYIKGKPTNNYLWYNGFMWRIMGINSDNTVRLITDENVTTLAYGLKNTALTYVTNEGYIHDWLNEYFYGKLNSTKNIIKEGAYFCSEPTTNETARTVCTNGSEVTAKVGLLSIDEYMLANRLSSYLNIKQVSWTMTPYIDSTSIAWTISASGMPANNSDVTNSNGVRPVINVSSTSTITGGDGTTSNFYVLGEDKSTNTTGTINEKATSGEYVLLEGKTYRVVSKDDSGVKLFLDGFYEETEGTVYTMKYNETTGNNTFTLDSGIGAKLNGDVLIWLGLSNSDKIITTTYYQGDEFGPGSPYTDALKHSNGVEAKVGLIQVGDILATQSLMMLTKNYTTASNYSNTNTYWKINKYTSFSDYSGTSTSNAWAVYKYGSAGYYDVTNGYGIRPVIVVRNDLNIISGTGVWNNPYQI